MLYRRLLRAVLGSPPPEAPPSQAPTARIQWPSGLQVDDLRPVRSGSSASAVNKAGRVAFRGMADGRPVKVYEAANECHATFILHVSGLSDRWPPLLGRFEHVVVAEWTIGEAFDAGQLDRLAALQASLHRTPASTLPPPGFDYWTDYIRPRFLRAGSLLGVDAHEICEEGDEAWNAGPRVLMHPDLSPANVVVTDMGELKVIDNELLTTGSMPLVDVCNTARALPSAAVPTYVAMYGKASASEVVANHALQSIWVARAVGASFVRGRVAEACELLRRYRAGDSILPFRS
jgi:hypothetical protein